MKKGQLCLSESNVELLMFIWRWKIATTQLLWSKFFPERALRTVYNRLSDFRRTGLIKIQPDKEGRSAAWTLSKKGFDIVRDHLPKLQADVYQTENFHHDVLVQAIHLGEWWNELPEGVSILTEQELRCYEADRLPEWVPPPNGHRPDGYWRFESSGSQKTIALEIELHRKNLGEYGFVGDFYESYDVDRVIWFVDNPQMGRTIQEKIETHTLKKTKHNFVLLGHYLKEGWKAKIFSGPELGLTVQQLLGSFIVKHPVVLPLPTRIDLRLFPEKPRSYRFVVSASNPN
jgi:hypothetical protein